MLVKENKANIDNGKWNHPAGWIEVGEDPISGVRREVEEETGHSFIPSNILGIYSLVREDLPRFNEEVRQPIKIVFIGKISDDKIRELEEDVSDNKWFEPNEIYNMDLNTLRDEDIRQMIRDYFSGKQYPLELLTHTIQK